MSANENAKTVVHPGALDGIRVVDLSVNILGPIATQMLGDMGADIIKVESPEGDFMRAVGPARNDHMGAFFLNMNRNKRSVVLNLKDPASLEALRKLIETADVLIHNMRPGAIKRLGLDYEEVKKINPNLVYAWASGFRPESDRAERPAYDDVIQGMSGIADLFKRRSGKPDYIPMMIADKLCGFALAFAVSTALLHRERTGHGQEVHVPMYDTMVAFNMIDHLWHGVLDEPEKGLGYQRALTPFRKPYATKDGHIAVMASTDAHWQKMFSILGRPELADDPQYAKAVNRVPKLSDLYQWVEEELRMQTTSYWQDVLDKAQIPNGLINTLEDLLEDPYLAEGGFFQKREHDSEGPMVVMAHPTTYSDTPASFRMGAPELGEHTEAVLSELAVDPMDIEKILLSAKK